MPKYTFANGRDPRVRYEVEAETPEAAVKQLFEDFEEADQVRAIFHDDQGMSHLCEEDGIYSRSPNRGLLH